MIINLEIVLRIGEIAANLFTTIQKEKEIE